MEKIKLTEKQVNNIVRNSVYRILNEDWKSKLEKGALGIGAAAGLGLGVSQCDPNDMDGHNPDPDRTQYMNDEYFRRQKFEDEHPGAVFDDTDLDYGYDEYSYNPTTDYDSEVGSKTSDYLRNAKSQGKPYKYPMAENKKRTIRLTESDLHRIIRNSVKRIISEKQMKEGFFGDIKKGYNGSDRIGRTGDETVGYKIGKTIGKRLKKSKK